MSLTRILSLVSLEPSRIELLSLLYYMSAIRWSVAENDIYPFTDPISLQLAHRKLRHFFLDGVTGYCRPSMDLLIGVVLKIPTMAGRYFNSPKKRRGNFFSLRSFSATASMYPVSFLTRCKNIHCYWIIGYSLCFIWLFKFIKSLRKCTHLVFGLECEKYEDFHSEVFVFSRTLSGTKHSTSFLNISSCSFGTGYGHKHIGLT